MVLKQWDYWDEFICGPIQWKYSRTTKKIRILYGINEDNDERKKLLSELCDCWGSDFRTHAVEEKHSKFNHIISVLNEKLNDKCFSNAGKTNLASAYYKLGNFKKSEEIAIEVLSNLKGDNTSCDINNKYNALARLFWIKNNQRKFNEAFNYLNQNIQLINESLKKLGRSNEKRIFIKTKIALLKSNLVFHEENLFDEKQANVTYDVYKFL